MADKYRMSSFSLQNYISHLPSQHNIPCCTASASLLAIETMMSTYNKKFRFSRLYVYYMTRKLQDRLGQKGAELGSTLEAMKQCGIATDATWPFAQNRVNTEPNAMAINEASQYKVGSYTWAEEESYKEYLHQNMPIIIGFHSGKMFWHLKGPLSSLIYKPINNEDNKKFKGHAATIVGYDDSLLGGSWIIGNSLGLTWGDHGFGLLPYECRNDIGESYVITNFAGITPGKKISEN